MTKEDLSEQLVEARKRIAELEAALLKREDDDRSLPTLFERSERLLNTIISTTPDWIFVKDREFRWSLANEAVARAMSLKPEDLVGKTDLEIGWSEELVFGNPAKGIRGYRVDDTAVLGGETIHNPHDPATFADGTLHVLDTWKIPLRDNKGEVFGVLAFSHDVTERIHAEEERDRLQQEVIEAQQRALQELSTPIIPIFSSAVGAIIVMPLVGSINTVRAQDIMRSLLAGIRQHRARIVILDVTGVPIVDSGVASHLNKAIQAARLKGARTIVTGVSDAVAETIVDLGIDWGAVDIASDLQTGLISAAESLGLKIVSTKTHPGA